MEKDFDKKVRKFNIAHKRNKLWYKLVTYLSAFVVFWTTYILILPAITLDRNTFEAGSSNTFAVSGTLTARVITREEIIELATEDKTFVWFARIGNQYYAFGSNGQAVPVNLSGGLEEGAILTYDGDDPDNIKYDIDRIFTNESSVTSDIRVTMKSVKTEQHVFPNSGNIFVDTDYEWERLNLHTITNVADGNSINTDLGNLMYSHNNILVGYTESGFQPLSLNYTTAPRTEQEVLYCAVVEDITDNPNPEEPNPEEPEEATFEAKVITRQEMIEKAAQNYKFVWFVRSGNEYYAFSSIETESGTVQAVPVKLSGTLQEGATLTYYGEDPDSINWDFDNINLETSNVNDNIDITSRSIKTDEYIFPNEEGTLFTTDTTWERLGINYITNTAEGVNINKNIGSVLWGWLGNGACIKYENGEFHVEQFPEETGVGDLVADDSVVFYCAIIENNEEPNPEEPEEPEEATFTANVITRQELVSLVAQGKRFVWFVRSGDQYYAVGSGGDAIPVNISGTLEQGATLTYSGDDPNNISWDFESIRRN